MAILNYTTEVSTAKSIGEITTLLTRAKAQAILSEFDGAGRLMAISFRVMTAYGVMSFRLPANVDKVFAVLNREKIGPRYKNRDQAERVAWRIIKDWLEAQLALIQVDLVTMEQVFLPYVQNNEGVTLYESLKERNFHGLALPAPKSGGA